MSALCVCACVCVCVCMCVCACVCVCASGPVPLRAQRRRRLHVRTICALFWTCMWRTTHTATPSKCVTPPYKQHMHGVGVDILPYKRTIHMWCSVRTSLMLRPVTRAISAGTHRQGEHVAMERRHPHPRCKFQSVGKRMCACVCVRVCVHGAYQMPLVAWRVQT